MCFIAASAPTPDEVQKVRVRPATVGGTAGCSGEPPWLQVRRGSVRFAVSSDDPRGLSDRWWK